MQKTYNEAVLWCKNNKLDLINLFKITKTPIIICPSFDVLHEIKSIFEDTQIQIGAQNCSSHEKGAYTGEISALSLKELGCSYCIIGHSERRIYFKETNHEIAQKTILLLKNNIIPIICVGETQEEKNNGQTLTVIINQLEYIHEVTKKYINSKIIVAYEPVWAIGTSKVPSTEELQEIIFNIKQYINASVFYGGSVNKNTIDELKKIKEIEGYLLGSASLDFQELKNIVLLLKEHKKN